MKSKIDGIATAQRQIPQCAFVFYAKGNGCNAEVGYATHHLVRENQGRFELEPGTSLTSANLKQIALMAENGLRHNVEILPSNVLAISDELLVWWTPATQQLMHFDVSMGDKAVDRQRLQGVSGKVPVPALVFMLNRSRSNRGSYLGISVHALAENARPEASTALYRAPLLNVDPHGNVCWGDGQKPKGRGVKDIPAWQALFFSSVFTHYNISSPIKGDDCYGFIADLLESKAASFPLEAMLPAGKTLQEIVAKITESNRG